MKKPINKVAVALWILAALAVVGEVCSYLLLHKMMAETAQHGDTVYEIVGSTWNWAKSAIVLTAQLVALGVIIELIDQIRWNALNRK
jgi:hypothetical protein